MKKWIRITGWGAAMQALIFCLACFDWGGRQLASQDIVTQPEPIVLRDLTLIRGKTVTDFDETSIILSDGTRLTWDRVLKAQVQESRQEAFDLKLKQLGLPLFRLKSRIGNGDWIGAGEIAGPIYDSSIAKGKSRRAIAMSPNNSNASTSVVMIWCLRDSPMTALATFSAWSN
jgi:hypothetical protein